MGNNFIFPSKSCERKPTHNSFIFYERSEDGNKPLEMHITKYKALDAYGKLAMLF